eukprot:6148209-Lingulodinium_polyedra.AAC.1
MGLRGSWNACEFRNRATKYRISRNNLRGARKLHGATRGERPWAGNAAPPLSPSHSAPFMPCPNTCAGHTTAAGNPSRARGNPKP